MARIGLVLAACVLLAACGSKKATSGNLSPEQSLKSAQINVKLGMNYLQEKKNDMAKSRLLKALSLQPNMPEANFAMGYYLFKVGEIKEAQKYYEKAYKIAPNNPHVLNSYGVFLCETGKDKKAEEMFIKATKVTNFTAVGLTYQNAGSCAYMHKDYKTAKGYFLDANKQDPRLPLPYLRLAQIASIEKNYGMAREYLHQFDELADPTIDSLRLGIELANHFEDKSRAASLQLQLDDKLRRKVDK